VSEAFQLFSTQVSPQNTSHPDTTPIHFSRSKRYALNIEDQQFLEMIASPVMAPAGQVVQVWRCVGRHGHAGVTAED